MPQSITWLLPVKNAMPYLTEALASIEAQSYPHWQVLAWDNGSSDGSLQELRRWIPRRLPGRVVADKPMGLGASLAQMVEQSNTPLCARMDGDDVNLPDRLEKQIAFLKKHPQVAVVGTDIQFIDEHGVDQPGAWSVVTQDADICWRLRFCNALNHPTVMFRRSEILAAENYRDIKPGQEDYDLWLRMSVRSQLMNLPDRLVRYRKHEASVGALYAGQWNKFIREIACSNAERLFPGVPAQEAIRLRDLVVCDHHEPVKYRDILLFRRAAGLAGNAIGQGRSYFRRTSLYEQQFRNLVLRWFKRQPGASAVWPVLGRVRRTLASGHQAGELHHELG